MSRIFTEDSSVQNLKNAQHPTDENKQNETENIQNITSQSEHSPVGTLALRKTRLSARL